MSYCEIMDDDTPRDLGKRPNIEDFGTDYRAQDDYQDWLAEWQFQNRLSATVYLNYDRCISIEDIVAEMHHDIKVLNQLSQEGFEMISNDSNYVDLHNPSREQRLINNENQKEKK